MQRMKYRRYFFNQVAVKIQINFICALFYLCPVNMIPFGLGLYPRLQLVKIQSLLLNTECPESTTVMREYR